MQIRLNPGSTGGPGSRLIDRLRDSDKQHGYFNIWQFYLVHEQMLRSTPRVFSQEQESTMHQLYYIVHNKEKTINLLTSPADGICDDDYTQCISIVPSATLTHNVAFDVLSDPSL